MNFLVVNTNHRERFCIAPRTLTKLPSHSKTSLDPALAAVGAAAAWTNKRGFGLQVSERNGKRRGLVADGPGHVGLGPTRGCAVAADLPDCDLRESEATGRLW